MTSQGSRQSIAGIVALVGLLVLSSPGGGSAQSDGFDADALAMTFHKVTGDPLDTRSMASRSQAAASATSFDRPDVIAREQARLEAQLTSMNPAREFTITIEDRITGYDRTTNEFSIELFTPGYYIPVQAFGQEYKVVFANAASARAIPMPTDQAREFDAQLNSFGRRINNEIHFKVIGKGDPVGGVSGQFVVRAEVTSVRALDQSGQVLFTPRIVATSAMPAFAGFDASKADVAGLRVGVRKRDMEATLTRLFGKVTPGYMSGEGSFKGFTGVIEVNRMGCTSMIGRKSPKPGAVCVAVYYDSDEVVRMVRVQRLFPPYFDGEVFRKALVQKYGPASGSRRGGIAWGPGVPGAVLNDPTTSVDALTASAGADRDISDLGGNRMQNVLVSLQLIDAAWAAKVAK